MKYCNKCNYLEYDDSSDYCINCGYDLSYGFVSLDNQNKTAQFVSNNELTLRAFFTICFNVILFRFIFKFLFTNFNLLSFFSAIIIMILTIVLSIKATTDKLPYNKRDSYTLRVLFFVFVGIILYVFLVMALNPYGPRIMNFI